MLLFSNSAGLRNMHGELSQGNWVEKFDATSRDPNQLLRFETGKASTHGFQGEPQQAANFPSGETQVEVRCGTSAFGQAAGQREQETSDPLLCAGTAERISRALLIGQGASHDSQKAIAKGRPFQERVRQPVVWHEAECRIFQCHHFGRVDAGTVSFQTQYVAGQVDPYDLCWPVAAGYRCPGRTSAKSEGSGKGGAGREQHIMFPQIPLLCERLPGARASGTGAIWKAIPVHGAKLAVAVLRWGLGITVAGRLHMTAPGCGEQ